MSNPLELPILQAPPFVLREWRSADIDLIQEASADALIPLITTVPPTFSIEEGLAFIARQHDRLKNQEGYSFIIAEAATDKAIGSIGLWLRNIDDGRASIGYWIVTSARGNKAANIALKKIICWSWESLKIPRLELYVEPWNTASIKTAENAGFAREGLMKSWQQVGEDRRDMYMYALIRT
jgi:RimJ/RimL family protein N-acetyltransferase